jgi:hypothetical protein
VRVMQILQLLFMTRGKPCDEKRKVHSCNAHNLAAG